MYPKDYRHKIIVYVIMNESEQEALYNVFTAYKGKHHGINVDGFNKLIHDISENVSERISESISDFQIPRENVIYAYFEYHCDSNIGKITFDSLRKWWVSDSRFNMFSSKTADLMRKAHKLYHKYTKGDLMTVSEFNMFFEDFQLDCREEMFEKYDLNSDGKISFKEFVDLLGWIQNR